MSNRPDSISGLKKKIAGCRQGLKKAGDCAYSQALWQSAIAAHKASLAVLQDRDAATVTDLRTQAALAKKAWQDQMPAYDKKMRARRAA